MTLFITTKNCRYEISDFYAMALVFIITFWVVRITKKFLKRYQSENNDSINQLRGGALTFQLDDEEALALKILTCIVDDQQYLVKNQKIKELIFQLVKQNIKKQSLVITPNLIRFLALKILDKDRNFVVKMGNLFLSTDNQERLIIRLVGGLVIASTSAIAQLIPGGVLLGIMYFLETANCGYTIVDDFEQLPPKTTEIYVKKPQGNLIITANENAKDLKFYTPSKSSSEIIEKSNGNREMKTTYKRSGQKAKQVKFSDFQKTDPVLSAFDDLEEPYVPNRACPVNDLHDIIDIRID